MNAKTATLINQYATGTNSSRRAVKNLWKRTPRNRRGQLRKKLLKEISPKPFPTLEQINNL